VFIADLDGQARPNSQRLTDTVAQRRELSNMR
jgi:hypothetical protein